MWRAKSSAVPFALEDPRIDDDSWPGRHTTNAERMESSGRPKLSVQRLVEPKSTAATAPGRPSRSAASVVIQGSLALEDELGMRRFLNDVSYHRWTKLVPFSTLMSNVLAAVTSRWNAGASAIMATLVMPSGARRSDPPRTSTSPRSILGATSAPSPVFTRRRRVGLESASSCTVPPDTSIVESPSTTTARDSPATDVPFGAS